VSQKKDTNVSTGVLVILHNTHQLMGRQSLDTRTDFGKGPQTPVTASATPFRTPGLGSANSKLRIMPETSGRFLNEVQTILLCKEASSMVATQRHVKSAASGRPSMGASFATPRSVTSRSTRDTPS